MLPRDPFAEGEKTHAPSHPNKLFPDTLLRSEMKKNENQPEKITSRRTLRKQTEERNTPQRVKKRGGGESQIPLRDHYPNPLDKKLPKKMKVVSIKTRRMEGSPNP